MNEQCKHLSGRDPGNLCERSPAECEYPRCQITPAAPDVAPTVKQSLTVAEQLAGLYPILSRLADPSNNRLGCGLDKLVAEAVGCYSDMVGLTQTYSATVDQAQADAVEIARLKACVEAADAMRGTHLPLDPGHGQGLIHAYDAARAALRAKGE